MKTFLQPLILPLQLFQEEHLSITVERMCTKYWLTASKRLWVRNKKNDHAQYDLKCVDRPYKI